MRMLLTAKFPTAKFNEAVVDGSVGAKLGRILEELKPETAVFTDEDGLRTGIFIVDLPEASSIPRLAEPFFLLFNAEIELKVVMTPQDLQRSGLDTIGKKWQ